MSGRRDCGADSAGERGPPPSIPDKWLPIVIPAKAGMPATSLTGLRAGLHRRRRFGGHSGRRARQFDRETAAAPESGTQLDARPGQRGDACADRQAQAEPPFLARFAAAELEELLEDLRLVDAGDTDASSEDGRVGKEWVSKCRSR